MVAGRAKSALDSGHGLGLRLHFLGLLIAVLEVNASYTEVHKSSGSFFKTRSIRVLDVDGQRLVELLCHSDDSSHGGNTTLTC